MNRVLLATLAALALGSASPASADIPTNDAAQLDQHSQTASVTVKLVPITTDRQTASSGVKCAVTTGKKASITDPTVQPQAGAGAQTIQQYSPPMPATPAAGATGGTLNSQTLFSSTATVVGGLDASQSTLNAARSAYQSAKQQVGSAPTVMGAFDMNTAARLQNGFAWNGAISSANLWVTAINALNLASTSNMSQAAASIRSAAASSPALVAPVCPVGMTGSGTAADPCRTPSSCSTTPPGTPPDPGCVAARTIDSEGNVLRYLSAIQSANETAPTVPGGTALSTADITSSTH
ncbi:hypothetical protein SAMN05519103_09028 [Rhizobiales bacterium GAS113]|nr:hypothetical protein SAMN05519103_09028 [Rhizobiales bacterium GAS113]